MLISELAKTRVGLLGLGREGLATLAALRSAGHHDDVYLFADVAPGNLPPGCCYVPLEEVPRAASNLDIVIRSPGFAPTHPLRQIIDSARCRQTTATQTFLHEARDASVEVIGITASKGKSTTSTLAHACLLAAGRSSVLVGNIGQPAIELLDRVLREKPVVVMELSSYQCADLIPGYGPSLASLGALFPEHLDYHGSLEAYIDAKLNIARTQRLSDALVCHADSLPKASSLELLQEIELVNNESVLHFKGGWFFDGETKLVPDDHMHLLGTHNRANACIAFALARRFGATPTHLESVLSEFRGLPFRLEAEGLIGGISWVNDSISTAPEATAAALEALGGKVNTLIAGGYERGYDPRAMAEAIIEHQVRDVILLPDTGAVIGACLSQRGRDSGIYLVASLEEAVQLASRVTPLGSTCLLSPGAPSYNAFSSFEERGLEFRRCIGLL
ncbi:MAG: UDP-N-acetylmuramoyl-L-alanine--D-glutamate ligase [Azonexus sp.]